MPSVGSRAVPRAAWSGLGSSGLGGVPGLTIRLLSVAAVGCGAMGGGLRLDEGRRGYAILGRGWRAGGLGDVWALCSVLCAHVCIHESP